MDIVSIITCNSWHMKTYECIPYFACVRMWTGHWTCDSLCNIPYWGNESRVCVQLKSLYVLNCFKAMYVVLKICFMLIKFFFINQTCVWFEIILFSKKITLSFFVLKKKTCHVYVIWSFGQLRKGGSSETVEKRVLYNIYSKELYQLDKLY